MVISAVFSDVHHSVLVSDIAVFVLKRDVKHCNLMVALFNAAKFG